MALSQSTIPATGRPYSHNESLHRVQHDKFLPYYSATNLITTSFRLDFLARSLGERMGRMTPCRREKSIFSRCNNFIFFYVSNVY